MIFPPAAIVHVIVNGAPVLAYRNAYIVNARVFAPVDPYVTAFASVIEFDGRTVLVRHGDRFAQVSERAGYVALGPILRSLGAQVQYDAASRTLCIALAPAPFATPTPFNPAVPQAVPHPVFTPMPQATPKPTVSGVPAPRRTPIGVEVTPQPQPSS